MTKHDVNRIDPEEKRDLQSIAIILLAGIALLGLVLCSNGSFAQGGGDGGGGVGHSPASPSALGSQDPTNQPTNFGGLSGGNSQGMDSGDPGGERDALNGGAAYAGDPGGRFGMGE